MELLDVQNKILNLFAQFYAQVKGATHIGRTDINKVAENALIPVFSEIFGFSHLRNLNSEKQNFPGIDLADDYAKIAFQITATPDYSKIKGTLEKFIKYEYYKKYNRLIIYVLTERLESYPNNLIQQIIDSYFHFNPITDIIDYRGLLNQITNFQVEKAQRILHILESNFSRYESILYQEKQDSRKEQVTLNLIEFDFPNKLFIAQVDSITTKKFNKKQDKRRALQDELLRKGLKFGADWEYFEGKIFTFHNLSENSLPLSRIIDEGSIERFSTQEFYEINLDYERLFKSLLRRCLQQKLFHRQVLWHYKEKLFFFGEDTGSLTRKEHWKGINEDVRVVYEKTMKTNKPGEILNCKHFAFQVEFEKFNNKWFLLINPDWLFTFDGYAKSVFCEKSVDWLKRHENNQNVFNHVRFISYFLNDNSMDLFGKKKPYPFLSFGNLLKFDNATYIDDNEWLPKKVGDESFQGQMNLLEDI